MARNMRNFGYEKLLKSKWDNEIWMLAIQIHEYKVKHEYLISKNQNAFDKLIDKTLLRDTKFSNAIYGVKTSDSSLKQLCVNRVESNSQEENELLGYFDALSNIISNYQRISLSSNSILKLHKELYKNSEQIKSGTFKISQNRVVKTDDFGFEEVVFMPVEPEQTRTAINKICKSFNNYIKTEETNPLILISAFIHDFLCIHPFSEGNGRICRMLTALLLYQSGYMVGKYDSIDSIIETNKSLYFEALQQSQAGWHNELDDKTPFIKFILKMILSAYHELDVRLELANEKLIPFEMVEKAVELKTGNFTKSDIMEFCPSISVSSIEKALKKLADKGVISKYGGSRLTYYSRKNE